MKVDRLPAIRRTLKPSRHPYMNGAWTPLTEEVNAWDIDLISGRVPDDIDGIYLRNTENQVHEPLGRFHPFDGDGMMFFNYSKHAPYMHYGVVGRDRKLAHYVPVELPGPRLPASST